MMPLGVALLLLKIPWNQHNLGDHHWDSVRFLAIYVHNLAYYDIYYGHLSTDDGNIMLWDKRGISWPICSTQNALFKLSLRHASPGRPPCGRSNGRILDTYGQHRGGTGILGFSVPIGEHPRAETQMLHGAGFLTDICPKRGSPNVGKFYMEHLGW